MIVLRPKFASVLFVSAALGCTSITEKAEEKNPVLNPPSRPMGLNSWLGRDREDQTFRQKVAKDPFPTAQQAGLFSGR